MSSDSDSTYLRYEEPGLKSKLIQKSREAPFLPIGVAGFLGIAAYGIYKIRTRGKTQLSVHLIHTRLAAQGFIVGAITCGMLYSIIRESLHKTED